MNILDKIEKQQIEKVLAERQIPDFSAGDTLKAVSYTHLTLPTILLV